MVNNIFLLNDVLVDPEILTEYFCCDLSQCKGACCVEGEAGAPLKLDEVAPIEDALDEVWRDLRASAQSVIDRQGIAYVDADGDLVTSIVGGKDCVFTCYDGDVCLCALEKASRAGRCRYCKPISCALYPIRAKRMQNGFTALRFERRSICASAIDNGRRLGIHVYEFLKPQLTQLFGEEWYASLKELATKAADVRA